MVGSGVRLRLGAMARTAVGRRHRRPRGRGGPVVDFEFNAVLVNGYRDGQDAMGWHRDNEKEIDTSCIASLSLGAGRTFKVEIAAPRRW